jgi:hypothetical protein
VEGCVHIVNPPHVPIIGERPDVVIEAVLIVIRCGCESHGNVLTFRVGENVSCPKCLKRFGMMEFKCAVGRVMRPGEVLPVTGAERIQ